MAQSFNLLPSGDVENDGWTYVASTATTASEILRYIDDSCYVRVPVYRGGLEIRFPTDVTDLPKGAIIDSITVFCRLKANAGSGSRSVTVNVLSSDNRSRYTTRTITATSSITTKEVGTWTKDPLGKAWDVSRLNKLRLRMFSYNNLADSVRIYALYVRVNFHTKPTVKVASPTGTVATPSPTVQWSYSQLEGEPQKAAEYKVFTKQQTTAKSFSPDTAAPVYAAKKTGIGYTYQLPTSLNSGDYAVYVRAQSTFGAWSDWVSKQFAVRAPAPGVPSDNNAGVSGVPGIGVPTVVPDNFTSSAAIRMSDTSNLLSVQQADFEIASDPMGYSGNVTRDTEHFYSASGTASMRIEAPDTNTVYVVSTRIEVRPGMPMTVTAQWLAESSSRSVDVFARWIDANGNIVGTELHGAGTDSADTWTGVTGIGSSAPDAKWAEVILSIQSPDAGEVHYVDHVGLMYGHNTAWSDGGHTSRNMLTSFLATGDDPASSTDAWVQANTATTVSRVASSGAFAHGAKCWQMTYVGQAPTIGYRATSAPWNSATSGSDFTLNKPSGVQDNDLLLAFVTSSESGTINPPPGWAAVNSASIDDGSTDIALHVLKRTALASDPTTWATGTLSVSSSRRTAVVVAYSGCAHADDQFIDEGVTTSGNEPIVIGTATVNNTDSNAWRVAAFAVSDDHTMSMTASTQPPQPPPIQFVGKAKAWNTTSRTSSYTLNKPSGLRSGDLMIATVAFSGVVSSVSTPSGWTLVRKVDTAASGDAHSGKMTVCIYKRTAGGSEPNSWSASHGSSPQPKISQVVAYRNCDTAANQFIGDNFKVQASGSSISTNSVTNNDSKAWRVCMFAGAVPSATSWASGDIAERSDDYTSLGGFPDCVVQFSDSNGTVGTGSHSRTGKLASGSYYSAVGWIGLIKPLPAATPGVSQTERVDFLTGSANPWECTAVYDSNGPVPTGQNKIYGVLAASDALGGNSSGSWIGLLKPASSVADNSASVSTNGPIDITDLAPEVLELCGGKLTMMATFQGSTAGTPVLTADFYRANQFISSSSDSGSTFETSAWTKAWAVFDIPEGTTRIVPTLSATDRTVGDTVRYDQVGVMLGALDDPAQEPSWRDGTARPEHPVWSKPVIQYQDNDGTGYGEWKLVPGQRARPPRYDDDGQMYYVDHTVVPLVYRRYRVQTVSYGLNGDVFASGYGPESGEVVITPGKSLTETGTWWLKDIQDINKNMSLTVRWKDMDVELTNTATQFQPLGADYPIVVTEGFKGDTIPVEIHCEQAELPQLFKLLGSGRTLILQSDIDKLWWVRPVGNPTQTILATSDRQKRPRRWVQVTFAQVAPEE